MSERMKNLYDRIFRRIPKKLRKNEDILEIVAAYIKIGGEKLAKQSVEVFKAIDKFETIKRKRNLRDNALLKTAGAIKIKQEIEASKHEKIIRFKEEI